MDNSTRDRFADVNLCLVSTNAGGQKLGVVAIGRIRILLLTIITFFSFHFHLKHLLSQACGELRSFDLIVDWNG